jgi:hypothetical protein
MLPFERGSIFFLAIGESIKERMGGEARPPAANGGGWGGFSEDERGHAWTGPILLSLIITTGKKMLSLRESS